MSKITKTQAILSLLPNAAFFIKGEGEDADIQWIEPKQSPFSNEQILSEMQRMQIKYDLTVYKHNRAAAYPDFRDYLDGIVKNDIEQIEKYKKDCLAVKVKYPKST